mmetsp:Transcript_90/g.165  ORF Transcript_90/g.165 Transcript_90/m.165 type:complete len:339 (+) Transcript_90:40-1056(+)
MVTNDTLPPPEKVVPYETVDGANGGALYLYGNTNAPNIAVCCAGYPDDHSIFQSFAFRLAKEGDCLVGVMCLPGFDDREEKPWTTHKYDGYTFDDMVISVRGAVKALRAASTHEDSKLTGIFHDWGVVPGSLWVNRVLEEAESPELQPDKMVYFDVLLPPHKVMKNDIPDAPKPTLARTVVEIVYKIVLAISFLLQQYVSKILGVIFYSVGLVAMYILRLYPLYHVDDKVFSAHQKHLNRTIYMAYPYWFLVKSVWNGTFWAYEMSLHKDLKKTPLLYIYGGNKRTHFHRNESVALLEREEREGRSDSKVICLEDDGHFFYVTNEDACLDAVVSFMKN